jgi:pimeloyl-ACP methyl ester carboxylesterase
MSARLLGHRITLPDGRHIGFATWGAEDGEPVLALHGTPGSRLKFSVAHGFACELGLRIIAPDRWDFGLTSRPARLSLAAFADDMRALADALRLERFSVIGFSGGGPYAAAVAARLGARIPALALVSPVGPIAGTAAAGALTAVHRLCFQGLPRVPLVLAAAFALLRRGLKLSPALGMRLAMLRTAPVDKACARDPWIRAGLVETFREGLAPGVGGCLIDLEIFSRPWDIRLEDVRAPARLWLGTEDRNVPRSAVLMLAAGLPRSELVELPGHGHLWVCREYPVVLAWIAEMLRGGAIRAASALSRAAE